MTSNIRQFEFPEEAENDESEDEIIKAVDEDGFPVKLEISDVTETREVGDDEIRAGWEDIVCPIVASKVKDGGDIFRDGDDVSMRVTIDFDECVERLPEIIQERDNDYGILNQVLDSETPERNARVLIEYLVEEDVLSIEEGELVLSKDISDELQDLKLLDADQRVLHSFVTWTGFLEEFASDMDNMYNSVDQKLESLSDELEKLEEEERKLEEKIQETRSELYNLNDGERLKPKKTDKQGLALEAPDQIDPQERERWKDLYNDVVLKELERSNIDFDQAREQLTNFLERADRTKDNIDRQVQRLRVYTSIMHNAPSLDELPEDFYKNIRDFQQALTLSVNKFISASQQSTKVSTAAVYGEEDTEQLKQANEDLEDAQEFEQEANQAESKTEEAAENIDEDYISQPEPNY
jgi:chaperonin cofactor prefoldin